MKQFVLSLLMISMFAAQSFASSVSNDINLTRETILRVDQLILHYHDEVEPLLKRYEKDENTVFNKSERKKILHLWTSLIDHRIVMHALYSTYSNQNTNYQKNLIRLAVNLSLQLSAAVLSKSLWPNKLARQKLNETNKAEIPRGSFTSLENELFRNFGNIKASELPTLFPVYSLEKDLKNFQTFKGNPTTEAEIAIEALNSVHLAKLKRFEKFATSWSNLFEVKTRFLAYKFKQFFYQMSKKISTWLGDTKVHQRDPDYYNGKTLINIKLAKKFEAKVKPGDIMISRTNWFLSNAFLPGFWPHSFLYLGDVNKFKAFFDEKDVNVFYKNECALEGLTCSSFYQYLQLSNKTKDAFKAFNTKDKYGYPKVLIEVTSDGTHFSSIRHTFLNDYLGALRPKLTKLQKTRSIVEALEMHGLEYDFDFDYHSDDRLVCSELVAKAYAPYPGKLGVEMNYDVDKAMYLDIITGRLALPVIGFVKKAYDENVTKLRASQFDFIAFLKGIRSKKTAVFSSEKEFYQSRNWPKWDFMQE